MGLIGAAPVAAQDNPPVDPDPIDLGAKIRKGEYDLVGALDMPLGRQAEAMDWEVGDTASWFGLDDYCGYYYFKEYELRAVGEYAEIWVALDLSWTIPPAEWMCVDKPTDPRPAPVVTDEQIAYLLDQFDTNIYPTDTEFFGMPDEHDGSNSLLELWGYVPDGYYEGEKNVILVDNFRDDNWYDPDYPFYIAGFYSPSYEAYFDRNIINIDAYNWEDRIGPDVARPYLYEGVIAHEYQHLIHDDNDPDEEAWVNEGMSMFAEWLCGYVAGEDQFDFFLDHAENSLVMWGDQEEGEPEILADYGIVYLWTLYMYEHFGGGPFVQALAKNETNGISGVNETLADYGYEATFADVFHDFRIATLIDSPRAFKLPFFPWSRFGRGMDWVHPYEFENAEVNVEVDAYPYDDDPTSPEYGLNQAWSDPGAPPWGTDYLKITDDAYFKMIKFDGADFVGTPAHSGEYHWYSTGGNGLWNTLTQEFGIPAGGATLNFWINYDTEEDWDYAYVMVHDLTADTWATLPGLNTTDVLYWPQDVQGDPWADPEDFCQPDAGGVCTGPWYGFTGNSGGYVAETMDLSDYAGHTIELSFVYWTDNYVEFPGAYIDDVEIPEIGFSDDMETEEDWVNSGWEYTTGIEEANFSVTLVGMYEKHGKMKYIVRDMYIDDLTEEGAGFLAGIVRLGGHAVMLVTFDAGEGVLEYAPYEYVIEYPWE